MFNVENPTLNRFGKNLKIASIMVGSLVLFLFLAIVPTVVLFSHQMALVGLIWLFFVIIVGLAGSVTALENL